MSDREDIEIPQQVNVGAILYISSKYYDLFTVTWILMGMAYGDRMILGHTVENLQ